jgi:hypothetical protein
LPSVSSYSEFQWRRRQFNLSFTYRFNKRKRIEIKNAPSNRDDEGGGYQDKKRTHENESFFIIASTKGLVNTGPFYKTIKLC